LGLFQKGAKVHKKEQNAKKVQSQNETNVFIEPASRIDAQQLGES
jgi:hypothetical protein